MIEEITTTVAEVPAAIKPGTISESDLVAYLSGLKGSAIIGLTVRTDARLKKTGNPFGVVWKVSKVSVLVNFHYDAGVVRRLEAEGKDPNDFIRGESWHVAVLTDDGKLTPFCIHPKTGELYIRCQLRGRGETTYFAEATGHELTKADIEAFLPKKSNYSNQGLDNPLEFLTYKLASVVEVVINGERWEVK